MEKNSFSFSKVALALSLSDRHRAHAHSLFRLEQARLRRLAGVRGRGDGRGEEAVRPPHRLEAVGKGDADVSAGAAVLGRVAEGTHEPVPLVDGRLGQVVDDVLADVLEVLQGVLLDVA